MKSQYLIFVIVFVFPFSSAFAEEMNIGKVYWDNEIISIDSFGKIIVKDNDMNKKEYPNFADKFKILVWSDTSLEKIEIEVVETGAYSGIFTGKIFVSNSQNEGKKLFANPGDFIHASYTDNTIPQSTGSSEIIGAAVVKISGENMEEYLDTLDPTMRQNTGITVPDWIKSNAGWWADGIISDREFVKGIEHLIEDEIITMSKIKDSSSTLPTANIPTTKNTDAKVPDWIKSNAGWWADGIISDREFVKGIEHLMGLELITVSMEVETAKNAVKPENLGSELGEFESQLEECAKITTAYKRIDCEKPVKMAMTVHTYKTEGQKFEVGPITYYWRGIGSQGNEFEISPTGQPILSIRILAENTSQGVTALNCTSPSICGYDIWDGSKSFKYSGMDFTSGQIVLNPNDAREFNILFGPNIGYGGTEFEYDSSKEYHFRINEEFGNTSVYLDLK